MIPIAKREQYAGLALIGNKAHHVVVLPERGESIDYRAAVKLVQEVGGTLPTAQELRIIAANLPHALPADAFWIATPHEVVSVADVMDLRTMAASQRQIDEKLRAVAVRRVPV